MQIKILPFGITKDIVNEKIIYFELNNNITVGSLRSKLIHQYPALAELNSLAIAINGEYALEEQEISSGDEVVLIPPVSGG